MERYTPEQRARIAGMICDLAREWIVQRESDFDLDVARGVQWCENAATGDRTPRPNPTLTFTLRINGGAQTTEGPPILPSPPVFRGPGE